MEASASAGIERMPLRCARGTAEHPSLAVARQLSAHPASTNTSICSVQRSNSTSPDILFAALTDWQLYPSMHSPLSYPPAADMPGECAPTHPWRGAAVQVEYDSRQSVAAPLKEALSHPKRDDADARLRTAFHTQCLQTRGPRGSAQDIMQKEARLHRRMKQPGQQVGQDRESLQSHGFKLNYELQQWMQMTAHRHRLQDMTHPFGFPPASQEWYNGPWIEDAWLATFARPVLRMQELTEQLINSTSTLGSPFIMDHSTGARCAPGTGPAVRPPPDASGRVMVQVQYPYDSELFHPWVPLFVPWENLMTALSRTPDAHHDICAIGEVLANNMHDSVQYVTVAQRAEGPWLGNTANCPMAYVQALRNTLVLSSGGVGHVPLPLLGVQRPFLQCSARAGTEGTRETHSHDLVFIGSSRPGTRDQVLIAISNEPGIHSLATSGARLVHALGQGGSGPRLARSWGLHLRDLDLDPTGKPTANSTRYEHAWIRAHAGGLMQLAPRGTGPTSFRLYESLQMGLVPIYVHDGQPWLPYLKQGETAHWVPGRAPHLQSVWARIAVVLSPDELGSWLGDGRPDDPLGARPHANFTHYSSKEWHDQLRVAGAEVRDRYFTYDGVVRRIAEFLQQPMSAELSCQGSSFVT